MTQNENNYDVIFIGSGMGAMAAASILAQFRDKRVLMLERHYVMGGFTHEFGRKQKWSWDVGIHYIGDMGKASVLRTLFDIIGRGNIGWNPMPDHFEKFVYPDFTFAVPTGEDRYKAAVIEKFPDEREAVEAYFEDVRKTNAWFGRHNMKSSEPFVDKVKSQLNISGFDTADITVQQYFDKNFRNPQLRALLQSQWGDYGIPPSKSSFMIHASVVAHYLNGGYYPTGGAGSIAKAVKPVLEEKGGQVLLSHEVEEILVENGKAVGVRARKLTARKGEADVMEFRAPLIISNAGAHVTYNRLLPESAAVPFKNELNEFYKNMPVTASVTLYCGLKDDPRSLGFAGENHWIYESYNHDQNFGGAEGWLEGTGALGGAYLSFPSLKNPEAKGHTAEIIALTPYEPFAKWKETTWKRRGEDYEAFKTKIADDLVAYINGKYPGFADLIEYRELSTPLTVSYFTGHPRGSIYGVPAVRERFRSDVAPWCQAATPVEGLYLTGADVSSPGVAGALMGAMATLGAIPDGIGFMKVLKAAKNAAAGAA